MQPPARRNPEGHRRGPTCPGRRSGSTSPRGDVWRRGCPDGRADGTRNSPLAGFSDSPWDDIAIRRGPARSRREVASPDRRVRAAGSPDVSRRQDRPRIGPAAGGPVSRAPSMRRPVPSSKFGGGRGVAVPRRCLGRVEATGRVRCEPRDAGVGTLLSALWMDRWGPVHGGVREEVALRPAGRTRGVGRCGPDAAVLRGRRSRHDSIRRWRLVVIALVARSSLASGPFPLGASSSRRRVPWRSAGGSCSGGRTAPR